MTSRENRCLNWLPVQSIETLEVSRRFRFRPEERSALLAYLGVGERSFVIDVGCGTGILSMHLAAGMPHGRVLGVDITEEFVTFASTQRSAANVAFVQGDAYALPIATGAADVATSYTLLGILTDPAASLREQMRITRPGGAVSAIEVVRVGMGHAGRPYSALPAADAGQLTSLRERWARVTADVVEPLDRRAKGYGWEGKVEELPLLFESVGLANVRLRGLMSTFSTSDETYPKEDRRWFLGQIGRMDMASIDQTWRDCSHVYIDHGFSESDMGNLRALASREHALRLQDFDEGRHAWAWHGTANLIVTGTKL